MREGVILLTAFVSLVGAAATSGDGAFTLASGTVLYLHLEQAIGTRTSKVGQAIAAKVVREVALDSGTAVPLGSVLSGTVEKCTQPEASSERAALLLKFNQLAIPGEGKFTLDGHLSGVSNARETLLTDGTIVGVLESEAPASLLGGVLQRLGQMDQTISDQIQKQKIGQVDTAITLPAGTDLQFTLSRPLALNRLEPSARPPELPSDLRDSIATLLANAPQRAVNKMNKPGDPINLVFIGTAEEIRHAFSQAGWTEPQRKNERSIWKTAEAVINNDGYGAAPVSDLYVFGRREDLAFEKMLNTFNKRHHLRLWQTDARAPDGRPLWLGAATHDVGIDIHPGVVSHATDANLDDERAQVDGDLVSAGDVQAAELVTPPTPLSSGSTATGGAWHTDGKLLVTQIK